MSAEAAVRNADIVWTASYGPVDRPPRLLIEIPHGATTRAHFHAVRDLLRGDLPEDLIDFYFVNTDVGAPEVAEAVVHRLAEQGIASRIVRSLLPRTVADCNRHLSVGPETRSDKGLTPAIPSYVSDPGDRRLLEGLHAAYHRAASAAYEQVCGGADEGGIALTLHTYAPKAVQIGHVDGGIVAALRRAYEPDLYPTWRTRPPVDLITTTPAGELLADPALVDAVRRHYTDAGIEVAENDAYQLLEGTMGTIYSERHPGRVLCLELRRDLLADPFAAFQPMHIGPAKVERMAVPLAAAVAEVLEPRSCQGSGGIGDGLRSRS